MKRKHRIVQIAVGSLNDERLADRIYSGGQRCILTYRLPVRAIYCVEGSGYKSTCKKALAMAAADGIGAAIVKSWSDITDGREPFSLRA